MHEEFLKDFFFDNNEIFLQITKRSCSEETIHTDTACLKKVSSLWKIEYSQGKDGPKVILFAETSFCNCLRILIWQLKRMFHKTWNLAKYLITWHTLLNLSKWLN